MSNDKFQGVDLQVARTPEENADWVSLHIQCYESNLTYVFDSLWNTTLHPISINHSTIKINLSTIAPSFFHSTIKQSNSIKHSNNICTHRCFVPSGRRGRLGGFQASTVKLRLSAMWFMNLMEILKWWALKFDRYGTHTVFQRMSDAFHPWDFSGRTGSALNSSGRDISWEVVVE